MQRFDHKVALVTGGDQGIGAVVASALVAAGARVVVCSRGTRNRQPPPPSCLVMLMRLPQGPLPAG